MSIASTIRIQIKRIPKGRTFGYADLSISKADYLTAAKALERMRAKDEIKKLAKGIFYVPEISIFGELKPMDSEQLRPYLFKNGKRVAYETGTSLYNQMGLTTQMAFKIKLACSQKRINLNRGSLQVKTVKSYVEITQDNYELLGLLDAIKDIKRIPDCPTKNAIQFFRARLKTMNNQEINKIIRYALAYPPRVRALLGAMLENNQYVGQLNTLKDSLNPLTRIPLRLSETDLPNQAQWYII